MRNVAIVSYLRIGVPWHTSDNVDHEKDLLLLGTGSHSGFPTLALTTAEERQCWTFPKSHMTSMSSWRALQHGLRERCNRDKKWRYLRLYLHIVARYSVYFQDTNVCNLPIVPYQEYRYCEQQDVFDPIRCYFSWKKQRVCNREYHSHQRSM